MMGEAKVDGHVKVVIDSEDRAWIVLGGKAFVVSPYTVSKHQKVAKHIRRVIHIENERVRDVLGKLRKAATALVKVDTGARDGCVYCGRHETLGTPMKHHPECEWLLLHATLADTRTEVERWKAKDAQAFDAASRATADLAQAQRERDTLQGRLDEIVEPHTMKLNYALQEACRECLELWPCETRRLALGEGE